MYEKVVDQYVTHDCMKGIGKLPHCLLPVDNHTNHANTVSVTNEAGRSLEAGRECVEALLRAGANRSIRDMNGKTALDAAVDAEKADSVRALNLEIESAQVCVRDFLCFVTEWKSTDRLDGRRWAGIVDEGCPPPESYIVLFTHCSIMKKSVERHRANALDERSKLDRDRCH